MEPLTCGGAEECEDVAEQMSPRARKVLEMAGTNKKWSWQAFGMAVYIYVIFFAGMWLT